MSALFLRKLALRDVKCFADLTLTLPRTERGGGWYVILGDNGTGKTTLLQAIAVALLGPRSAVRLLGEPARWIRSRKESARLSATFETGAPGDTITLRYKLRAGEEFGNLGVNFAPDLLPEQRRALSRHTSPQVMLLAGYGAYRRFERKESRSPGWLGERESAVQTLFFPEASLTDAVERLKRLDHKLKDAAPGSEEHLVRQRRKQAVLGIINRLLPPDGPFRLVDVTAEGALFEDGARSRVTLEQMSDGYRTLFALAADLLMWAENCPNDCLRRDEAGRWHNEMPGIVLIDGVDAHLHPRWQQAIGFHLQEAFPCVQFIVTTHSPLIAQAASREGLYVLQRDRAGGQVTVDSSLASVQGWRADQILSSPAFGLPTTRDPVTERLVRRHGLLRAKQDQAGLTGAEERELLELAGRLERLLPPPGNSYDVLRDVSALIAEDDLSDD